MYFACCICKIKLHLNFHLGPNLQKMKSEDLKKVLLTRKLGLYLGINVECCIWSTTSYGAETWTFWKVDQKHLKSFEMWCWRRMEEIGLTNCMRNEVFCRITQKRNILHMCTIKRREANWIGHILPRDCP
jgi:hypothetical protein